LLESSIITPLFWIIFQVVESKRATALSVDEAAHAVKKEANKSLTSCHVVFFSSLVSALS
jgi:hypothetical protein